MLLIACGHAAADCQTPLYRLQTIAGKAKSKYRCIYLLLFMLMIVLLLLIVLFMLLCC